MSKRRILAAALLAAGGVITAALATHPRESKLPQAAREFLSRHYPKAEIYDIDMRGHDHRFWDVDLKESDPGRSIEAYFTLGGRVIEIDDEVTQESAPSDLVDAVNRLFPGAEIQSIRKETRTEILYEFDIRRGDDQREVRIAPHGKIVEIDRR